MANQFSSYQCACEFCIRMTSSESDVCGHPTLANPVHWAGSTIQIKQNGKVIANMPSAAKDFKHCLPMTDVDIENDEFSLHATTSNGVCITGLYINEEQLLVGKYDDLEGFWLDHDQPNCVDGYMSSSHMIIKNGKVVLSQCKPRLTNGWIETVADCYLGNRDPSRCKGGYCAECGEEGYCCSGHNYKPGTGPGNNADNLPACPQEAVDIITSNHHVCVSKAQPEEPLEEVCIKITSNMDDDLCTGGGNKAENWLGGDINLKLNGEIIGTTSHGFLDFERCVGATSNDEFQFEATSIDGVCITSLSVNGKQLLVGKNGDLQSFWMSTNRLKCTGQRMTTSEITIKDGKIISSECPVQNNSDDDSDDDEPLLVWHGESDIAILQNNAGEWTPNDSYNFFVGNMFDDDESTFWHSGNDMANVPKSLVIEFKELINFHELTIKRRGQFDDRYGDACIVLNDDIDNQLCTDTKTGFLADQKWGYITWKMPTDNVRKVELVFRKEHDYYGHAQIADLKILYRESNVEKKPTLVWYGESDIATLTNNAGEWPPAGSINYVIGNMFDDDASTFWHNGKDDWNMPKSLVIEFKERIQFQELTIQRRGQFNDRYEDACIVLNDDIDNQLCTDSKTGFAGQEYYFPFITWRKPTDNVKKVELVFRNVDNYYGHAQIADLKIFYKAIDPIESCIDYRSDLVCSGDIVTEQTLPVTTENEATLQTTEGYGMCASLCIGTPGAISFNWVLKGSSGKCTCLRKVFVER